MVVYKHAPEDSSKGCADRHPESAIVSFLNTSTKSLRLFFPAKDLELDFRDIRCLDYACSLKKGSDIDVLNKLDIEGRPDNQVWKESKNLNLPLGDHGGRCSDDFGVFRYISGDEIGTKKLTYPADFTVLVFMDFLTRWHLDYFEDVSKICLKSASKFSLPKKFEQAQVMLWRRMVETGLSLRLLVRLSVGNGSPWLSMSCKSPCLCGQDLERYSHYSTPAYMGRISSVIHNNRQNH